MRAVCLKHRIMYMYMHVCACLCMCVHVFCRGGREVGKEVGRGKEGVLLGSC